MALSPILNPPVYGSSDIAIMGSSAVGDNWGMVSSTQQPTPWLLTVLKTLQFRKSNYGPAYQSLLTEPIELQLTYSSKTATSKKWCSARSLQFKAIDPRISGYLNCPKAWTEGASNKTAVSEAWLSVAIFKLLGGTPCSYLSSSWDYK